MAVRALHLVAAEPDVIEVPIGLLTDAVANAGSLAGDLSEGIAAVENRIWAGSRAGALNELGRLQLRVDAFEELFIALNPVTPQRPAGA